MADIDQIQRDLAHRAARDALADIANAQMNTWTKFPTSDTPESIIAHHVMVAFCECDKLAAKNEGDLT